MIPGRALHRLAKLLLPSGVCEQIVDAQLADFQHEWVSASGAPKRVLALVRGYLAFGVVFVSCAIGLRGIAADDRRALRRVFVIAAVGTVLATVDLAIAFMGNAPLWPAHADAARLAELQRFRWVMFFNFASQLLPFAASVGLVCGIAIGLQRHASRASRRVVLVAAAASCVAIFVLSNWILPPGFRALSQVIRGQPSAGQPAAATLGDVRRAMVAMERTPTAGPGSIRGAEVGYYLRWSWPFSTFALGLLPLSLIHRGRTARIILGIAGCWAYFYLARWIPFQLAWASHLAPIIVAWLPNLVFVALSIVIMMLSRVSGRRRLQHA